MMNKSAVNKLGDLIIFAGFISILSVITFALMESPMPEAHFNWSTKQCVNVINFDERFEYTCETLPEKYTHVWVNYE